MRKACFIFIAISLVIAFVVQGGILHFILLVLVAEYVLAPLLIVLALVWVIIRICQKKTGVTYRRWALSAVLIAASALLSYLMGTGIHQLRLKATRQYVTALVTTLDDEKQHSGKYPANLLIHSPQPLLQILGYPLNYSSDGNNFRFEYWDPGGMMDGYEFESSTRRWNYFD